MERQTPIPLAIVGIGCRFPGDATSPEKLWDLLAEGKSAWSKVPAERWNEDAFLHPDADDTNGSHNHAGGHFLRQDPSDFDAGFFNVLPGEASSMDPQQRLLLETTYEALESAGIRQEDIQKTNTAVYTAIFTRDYDRNVYKDTMSIPKYHATGTGDAILANRISHLFDLNGASVTMDTGCSGGMAAISHACQALRSGDADMALAGAANLILTPDHMISMSNLHMLNKDGRSFSFDSRGAGYGRGEGIATLVIKRLDDAVKANDPIRAVLLDASVNQDGRTSGITLPSGIAQEALQRKVWGRLNLSPSDVGYVEAHGTGTLAGDGAELDAISRVFCHGRAAEEPVLRVGSIKSNIGHTECASGLAAVIKGILVLEHGAVPPNVNLEQIRPSLNLEQKRISIPRRLEELPVSKAPAAVPRVSINSFGYGGTNAHAVLERFSPQRPALLSQAAVEEKDTPRLFVLSAASQASLQSILSSTADWVEKPGNATSLSDLAYTLSERRSLLPWRHTSVASNPQELFESLRKASNGTDSINRISSSSEVKVGFVFSGQGAQWAGMGRELLADTVFQDSINGSNQMLKELGSSWDLIEELLRDSENSRLKEAELAQPATTAIQIALVDMVRQMGVVPDAVVGHSSGEIAAAYAAGYLSHRQAIKAAYFRGFSSSIAKKKGFGSGGMMAVGVGETEMVPYLQRLTKGKAVVACQNSPSSATISGDDAAIDELSDLLKEDSVFNRRLLVDTAYHSHHMQAAAGDYLASLDGLEQTPRPEDAKEVNMFSSVTGSLKTTGFDADYWVSNLVGKVRFCDALQALCRADQTSSSRSAQPHRVFIEIGPHAALAGPARQTIAELGEPYPYTYTSVLVRGVSGVQSALTMAGSLFTRGFPVSLPSLAGLDPLRRESKARVLTTLPGYSWDHSKKYWHESRLSKDYRFRKHAYHDLLGLRMTDNSPMRPVWRHMVGVEGLPWLKDHVVDSLIIFPGAGYLCMAIEATLQLASDRHPERNVQHVRLRDVSFLKGLIIPEGRTRVELQLALNPVLGGSSNNNNTIEHTFSVTAFTGDENWNEYCRGSVAAEFAPQEGKQQFSHSSLTYGEVASPYLNNKDSVSRRVASADLYRELHQVGNAYGPTFSGIQELELTEDTALFTAAVPNIPAVMPAGHLRPHLIHPSTLDILLHSTLPLVNQKIGAGSVMPVRIDHMAISSDMSAAPGTVFSAVTSLTSSRFRAAEADMVVFAGKEDSSASPILSVSGMELRSLASDALGGGEVPDGRNICYGVNWVPDARFLSAESLESSVSAVSSDDGSKKCLDLLSGYAKHQASKKSDLSVLHINGSHAGGYPTSVLLDALRTYKSLPAVYDYTSQSEEGHETVKKELQEWAGLVKLRTLDLEQDAVSQGFTQGSYDVVFALGSFLEKDNVQSQLANVRQLLNVDGILVLIQDLAPFSADVLSQAGFKQQVAVKAGSTGFVVARAVKQEVSSVKIKFLSGDKALSKFSKVITDVSDHLTARGVSSSIVQGTSWSQLEDGAIHIVLDDGSDPLLSHVTPEEWSHVVGLLQKPSRVIWVSVQDDDLQIQNPKKQLITGVSRTAHAENDRLDMVTVDVQQTWSEGTRQGITDFLTDVVLSFPHQKEIPYEREYVYRGSEVLVPRVLPNDTLNRQISRRADTVLQTEKFGSSQLSLKLDTDKENNLHAIFTEDHSHREPLDPRAVEIEVSVFGVSPKSSPNSISVNEYAGIVKLVGTSVSHLKVGDRVIAWDASPLANRPRVPASQVQLIPDHLAFTAAAALPVSFMTASRALVDIAAVQVGQTILVDGASTDLGQAVVSVSRFLGARVIATVGRTDEAVLLERGFKIPAGDIVSREDPFLYDELRRRAGPGGLDVVLGCAWSPIPSEVVSTLSKSGTLVQLRGRGNNTPSIASGTSVAFDLGSLAQANPIKTSQLLASVMEMVGLGLEVAQLGVTSVGIDNLQQSLKLAQQGGMDKYVVQVDESSSVRVSRPSYTVPRMDPAATYVVSGGLGDLGQRMIRLMANGGARTFVTLSRSGATPAQHESLEKQLQELSPGARLHCLKCDVSKEEAVKAAYAEMKALSLPSVKGVIQASLVLKDSVLDNMTAAEFDSVLQAKAFGTLHLQKVFGGNEDLEFFLSLSSAVNMIGSAGQANYNAANSLQDALAQFDGGSGSPAGSNCFYMALNIGLIEDANVNSNVIIQSVQRQGLKTIYHEELNAYFEYALSEESRRDQCHQAVIGFTPETLAETSAVNGNVKTLMFTHVRQQARDSTNGSGNNPDEETAKAIKTFKDLVAETEDQAELETFVANSIACQLADLMAIDQEDVVLEESIQDLGIDSLIAIELRNWIMREFAAPIQSSEVLDSPSLWILAQKVLSRSQLLSSEEDTASSSSSSNLLDTSTRPTTRMPSQEPIKRQRILPVPDLSETLRMFADSRKALGSSEELEETERVIREFEERGPELQDAVRADYESRLTFYDNNIHLERREALQDHATFFIGHLTDGVPKHSQAERAAIITGAALHFKKRLENGTLEQHKLNDIELCMETLQWLFNTNLEPGLEVDVAQKYPSNNNVVVLRKGQLYEIVVHEDDDYSSLKKVFDEIIASTEDSYAVPLSVLSTKRRDEWSALRTHIKSISATNAATLEAIESSAFVVSLDDSQPETPSERCTAILLNDRHLTNRWLDKMLQFSVATNGVSALVGENTKLDGLSARQLSEYMTNEIINTSTVAASSSASSTLRKLTWDTNPAIVSAVEEQTAANLARYHPIGSSRRHYSQLSRAYLGSKGLRSKGTVLMAVLMATRLFYGRFEPVWETITLAKYSQARIDWLQTVTPDVAAFVEAALRFQQSQQGEGFNIKELGSGLKEAAVSHVQSVQRVADGRGFVEPLYALLGAATAIANQDQKPLPSLFESTSWQHSDRHATPKRAKTDCLGSGGYLRMQEGGFLMPNKETLFIHYEVHHADPLINVNGREEDVDRFVEILEGTLETVRVIIEKGL